MAVVVDSLDEVREYLEESGADVENMERKNSKRHLKYSRFQVDAIWIVEGEKTIKDMQEAAVLLTAAFSTACRMAFRNDLRSIRRVIGQFHGVQ